MFNRVKKKDEERRKNEEEEAKWKLLIRNNIEDLLEIASRVYK